MIELILVKRFLVKLWIIDGVTVGSSAGPDFCTRFVCLNPRLGWIIDIGQSQTMFFGVMGFGKQVIDMYSLFTRLGWIINYRID